MDERLILGIREFNQGRYVEAHDVLEDFWQGYRESDRSLLQALIHASTGFYQFQNGNLKGCHSQLSKAMPENGCLRARAPRPAAGPAACADEEADRHHRRGDAVGKEGERATWKSKNSVL